MASPTPEAGADQFAAATHLQCERNGGESANQTGYEKGASIGPNNTLLQSSRKLRHRAVLAPEQHTQNERRKGIGRDQSSHLRLEESVTAAVANNQQQFGHGQLRKDDAEDEKDARVLRKSSSAD